MVVARGVSLVSAAVEASDAGLLGDAGDDESTPSFESGHGGASGHRAPTAFPPPPSPTHAQEPHDEGAAGGGGTGGSGAGGGSGSSKHH